MWGYGARPSPRLLSLRWQSTSTWWMRLGKSETNSVREAELTVFCVLPPPPPPPHHSWDACPPGHVCMLRARVASWMKQGEIVPVSGEAFSPLALLLG